MLKVVKMNQDDSSLGLLPFARRLVNLLEEELGSSTLLRQRWAVKFAFECLCVDT